MIKKKNRNTNKENIDYPVIEMPLKLDFESLRNYSNYNELVEYLKDIKGDFGKAIIKLDINRPVAITSSDYKLVKHKDMVENIEKVLKNNGLKIELFDINFGGKYGNRVYLNYILPDYKFKVNNDTIIPFIQAYSCYDKFLSVGLLTGIYREESEGVVIFKKKGQLPKRKHFRKSVNFKDDMIRIGKWISDLGSLRRYLIKLTTEPLEGIDSDYVVQQLIEKKMHQERFYYSKVLQKYINEFKETEYSLLFAISDYITHKYMDNKKRSYDRSRNAQINLSNLFFE